MSLGGRPRMRTTTALARLTLFLILGIALLAAALKAGESPAVHDAAALDRPVDVAIAAIGQANTERFEAGALPSPPRRPNEVLAQANSGKPGIGGTGNQSGDGNGIGGTGQRITRAPGIGGTGIIGTITGFGSILVNGFEIDFAPDLPISFQDKTVWGDALRVGHVVEIEADGKGQRLTARRIAVRHEVGGPIQSIDRDKQQIVVLGQTVMVSQTIIAVQDQSTSLNDIAVGDRVDVSGLRRDDGVIVASRVDKAVSEAALIRGTVENVQDGSFTVNGVRVTPAANLRPPGLAIGVEVEVIGALFQRDLNPIHIKIAPASPFAGRVQRLSIEGFVEKRNRSLMVGGVAIARQKQGAHMAVGDRVVIRGVLTQRHRLLPTVVKPSNVKRQRGGEPGRMKSPALQRPHIYRQPSHPLHERSRSRTEFNIRRQRGGESDRIKPLALQRQHFFRQPSYDRPRFGTGFGNHSVAPLSNRRH
jgi:Domain of unknown function (DUF5666)